MTCEIRWHRRAIALDDGRLIFANDDDLTAAEEYHRGAWNRIEKPIIR